MASSNTAAEHSQTKMGAGSPFIGTGSGVAPALWVEFAIASCFLSLWLYTRFARLMTGFRSMSFACSSWLLGFIAMTIVTAAIGKSSHGFSSGWKLSQALMYTWVSLYLGFLALGLGKIAVGGFLCSSQVPLKKLSRRILMGLACSNMLIDVILVLLLAFRCSPPSKIWEMDDPSKCSGAFASGRGFGYFASAWNVISSAILVFFALITVPNAPASQRIKTAIYGIVGGLGTLILIFSCVRAYYMSAVHDPSHFTNRLFYLIIFTYTEMWLILIASSLPALWPHFSGRGKRSRPKNNRHSSQQASVDLNRMLSVSSGSVATSAGKTPRQHTKSQYGGSTAESIKTPVPVHRGASIRSTFSRPRTMLSGKVPHYRSESVEKIMPNGAGNINRNDYSNSGRNTPASCFGSRPNSPDGDDDMYENPFGDHNVEHPEKSIVVTKDIVITQEGGRATGGDADSSSDTPKMEFTKRASTTTGDDDAFFESSDGWYKRTQKDGPQNLRTGSPV